MDATSAILLFVVLISVIVWIIAAKKLKSRGGGGYTPPDPRMESYGGEVTVMEEAVKQHTIYQNHVKNDTICCPHCDGEVSKNAVQCDICGAAL